MLLNTMIRLAPVYKPGIALGATELPTVILINDCQDVMR